MTINTSYQPDLDKRLVLQTGEIDISALSQQVADEVQHALGWGEREGLHLSLALYEALTNAVDHGNLQLSSALIDTDITSTEDPFRQYTRERNQRLRDPRYARRRVVVAYRVTAECISFTIEDEGGGFDFRTLPDPTLPENLARPYGRGLALIYSLMDEVRFNASGSRITLVKHIV